MRPNSPLPRAVPVALVLLCALLGAGCFTFETLIRVRPDGSGVIEETFLLSGPVLEMMAAFGGDEAGDLELFSEEDLQAKAAAMGGGARLLGVESIQRGGARGYVARFGFDDVAALDFDPQPGGGLAPETDGPAAPSPRLAFAFSPGPPAVLRLRFPRPDSAALAALPAPTAPPSPADSTERAMQQAMLREMLKDGRFRLGLAVDGTLLDTDATYHTGDQITLLDVDFNALLADQDGLERLSTEQPRTFDDVRLLLQEIEGLAVEMQHEVVVRFE